MEAVQGESESMHELSLSQEIVRAALQATDIPRGGISAIGIEVGALSGVNMTSMEFCMRVVLDNEGMEHVQAKIAWVPAKLRCACGSIYKTDDMFAGCPACGGFQREVLSGKDVSIQYVETDDGQG